jgi:hypothetical protein
MLCVLPPFSPPAVKAGTNGKPIQVQKKEVRKAKEFRIQFFSLKSGNSIAPAVIFLYDRGAMEIKVEHEALITSRAVYTAAGFIFQADWEFTANKEKVYHYFCHFTGLYFINTYITGLVNLKELIEEDRHIQDIPFIFFATAIDKNTQ